MLKLKNPSVVLITLRDYFAAHAPINYEIALQNVLTEKSNLFCEDIFAMIAKMRFAYADAMLTERKNK